jgi:hypothetical protein
MRVGELAAGSGREDTFGAGAVRSGHEGSGLIDRSGWGSGLRGSILGGKSTSARAAGAASSFAAGFAGWASPSRFTANTALHTLQRARTPASGTLAGSTR